ncbi:MAG: 4-(cytidine 5'-diphospho)-2-C-methyl-D-erythritol kinase [Rhodospirillaceae bacterium]
MIDSTAVPEVCIEAPAKINLYLHVVGRRDSGYHDLDSLVMFATEADSLTIAARPGAETPSLHIDGPFAASLAAEPPAGNLVIKAALALAALLGRPPAVAITLTKRLPIASGIGGGSADAAACLIALCRLWGADAGAPDLFALAARLGADVPVCLEGRAAYFAGIGDILSPAPPLPDCPALLVNPGVAVPTPAVFRNRAPLYSWPARLTQPPASVAALADALSQRRNDLTEAAILVAPVIAEVLAALAATDDCLLARLSGSGATCFALYPDDAAAGRAAAALAAPHPDWWVRPCRLVAKTAGRQPGGVWPPL